MSLLCTPRLALLLEDVELLVDLLGLLGVLVNVVEDEVVRDDVDDEDDNERHCCWW